MPPRELELKHAIINSYREDLRDRYSVENCRKVREFGSISDANINALRDYFLECIYPHSKDRDTLDEAFDRMGEIIRSPKRLTPLMLIAVKSVWRLGVMFPSAVAAGRRTLEAYLETRRIEAKLLEYAVKNKLSPKEIMTHSVFVRMVAYVPEKEILRFRGDVLKLFESLSNVKLLEATVEIMNRSRELMEHRPDLYAERDLEGFNLGYEILDRGLALFQRLKPSEFPLIIRGIEAVEIDWYDRVKAEAAGA